MQPFAIDAHAHIGRPGVIFAARHSYIDLLSAMDQLHVESAVCTDHLSLAQGAAAGLAGLREVFEQSEGRIYYQGVYDPRCAEDCVRVMRQAKSWPGFVGLKVHPSFHRTPAESSLYEDAWRFAADNDLPILTHSWSLSDYNPLQALSTPMRFERWIKAFSQVRFVLGHAGGRGTGRHEAIQLVNDYENVFMDFSGDVFCQRLIEDLVAQAPREKVLYGSDFPWIDPHANYARVFLSNIDDDTKRMILRDNALKVYRLGKHNA